MKLWGFHMKRALLVGINYVGSAHELHGCINDLNNMNVFLLSRGFTDIKMIQEADATTIGIVKGLEWLTTGVSPGDVIVFHYSGHGSQIPSQTEVDGFEEIICPVDLNWMDKVITDVTLSDIFNKVPNGVNVTVILDCCHSGTMLNQLESLDTSKEILQSISEYPSRYLEPPLDIVAQIKTMSLVDWKTSKDVNATALLIAGCHANQTSADALICGSPQGAATAALLQIASTNTAISYKTLVNSMCNFMTQNKYTQVPELDGDKALYDQVFLEPFSFTVPTSISSDQIIVKPTSKFDPKGLVIVIFILSLIAIAIIV